MSTNEGLMLDDSQTKIDENKYPTINLICDSHKAEILILFLITHELGFTKSRNEHRIKKMCSQFCND